MQHRSLDPVVRHIRRLADGRDAAELTDGQLLDRFAAGRDPDALAALVGRHGPLVLGVCRRVLGPRPEAEDAFQATFLVLLRRAAALDRRGSLGPWLYAVAHRTALRARAVAARFAGPASPPEPAAAADPLDELTGRELCAAVDEELARLPEKLRAPLVLCCLEGHTRDEAAELLGCSAGAVKGRLERGRERLRARLARRGLALSAAFLAALAGPPGSAAVPAALARNTVDLVAECLRNPAAARSAHAASLADGVLRGLSLGRLKCAAAALALGVMLSAAGLAGYHALGAPAAAPAGAAAPATRASDGPRLDALGDPLPAGAVARLGTLRFRHQHTVCSVAFAGGGATILSAGWDGTVRLWDAATGRELRRFPRHDDVTAPVFSPDGSTVATVADPTGAPGDARKALRLWDLATGKAAGRILCPEDIELLRFSPDGDLIATRGRRAVRLWERGTGREVGRLPLPEGGAGQLAFAADGRSLAAACPDGTVRVWDVPAGRERQRFPSPTGGEVGRLAFAPDGRALACGGGPADRAVHLVDLGAGREVRRLGPHDGWVESVAFSPDGRRLASGDQHGTIRVYDVAAGRELCRCGLHPGNWVMALAFSPDGATLAAGGTNEKAVRRFDAATGRELRRDDGHQDEITGLAFLPGGRTLVSAGRDGRVCVWDPAGERVVRQWTDPGGAGAFAVSPDGRTLATGGTNGAVRLWDPIAGRELRRFTGPHGEVSGVAFCPDGTLVGAAADHMVYLWDVATGRERLRLRPPEQFVNPLPFAFTPDGKTLVTGTGNQPGHPIWEWDLATGKALRPLPGHADDALVLAFSPDGRLLASASWDDTTRLTEVATGQVVRKFKESSSVFAFSADGRTLVSGDVDGTVRLWDLASGRERGAFRAHESGGHGRFRFAAGVSALAFTDDGRRLASGGGDTTVLVWDLAAVAPPAPPRPAAPTPRELDALWEGLAAADAARAEEAVWALAAAPDQAVPLLAARLRPVVAAETRHVTGLIAALDSDRFEERDSAARDLTALGERARPALCRALAERPSPEARRRLAELHEKLDRPDTPERLRGGRAVAVLGLAGTPAARALLRELAGGMPEARLTQAAAEALKRQAGRPAPGR